MDYYLVDYLNKEIVKRIWLYKCIGNYIRQINNIDFLSEVSTIQQFVYTDETLLLVRQ